MSGGAKFAWCEIKDKDRIIVLQNIEGGYLVVVMLSVSDYVLSVWHALFTSHLVYNT